MANMITLSGGVALSPFRVNHYISVMNKSLNSSAIIGLRSLYVHYVEPNDSFNPESEQMEQLKSILEYGTKHPENDPQYNELRNAIEAGTNLSSEENQLLYVVPLSGTISPWSSKATNILQNCGLDIARVERGIALLVTVRKGFPIDEHIKHSSFLNTFHDRMTQQVVVNQPVDKKILFDAPLEHPAQTISRSNLAEVNKSMGLALDANEIEYLNQAFPNRDPTDAELFMFAQVNSEHCRHKIFNAQWKFGSEKEFRQKSLFKMIKATHENNAHLGYTISAYSDNAAVMQGSDGYFYAPNELDVYTLTKETVPYLAKVETHNHPTAISPFPGAATGSGGEIRDEGAVGQGSKSKAGLSGFVVSDLRIPGFEQPWEMDIGKPDHIASPLDIMIEAPLGSCSFNNEFGRPALTGFFRTMSLQADQDQEIRGYHKPIMLAGGVGTVRPRFALKNRVVPPKSHLIVLGGPAMLIGLGGGAASSVASGGDSNKADLDFASVQRGNPEMQRRAQMVIDACIALGPKSPILCIHDVGAGGLSNAFTELVHDNGLGGVFDIRKVPCLDESMSPMEIWCCEAQERYVLAVSDEDLPVFEAFCKRERAPYGIVGYATAEPHLTVNDSKYPERQAPIDLDMSVLFGNAPKMQRTDVQKKLNIPPFELDRNEFKNALHRVLRMPSVGSKQFLVTIGDRSITGLVAREQMVGPWQVPVADVAVTATSYGPNVFTGEAFASGERPTLAIISSAAASRVALAESLLNLYAADVRGLDEVRLSANWMAAPQNSGDGYALYEAVSALSEACISLNVSVPVGKDSMSMRTKWEDKEVISPVTVDITAYCAVNDVRRTWTPVLSRSGSSKLVYISTGSASAGGNKLGGSAVAQAYGKVGGNIPDVDIANLNSLLNAISALHKTDYVLAYHDVSDGGVVVTVLEMAFAARVGVDFILNEPALLFDETPGCVFQVRDEDLEKFTDILTVNGVPVSNISVVAEPNQSKEQTVLFKSLQMESTRAELQAAWSLTSHHIQRLRDNPKCADQELANIADNADPGLQYHYSFEPKIALPVFSSKPRVAILREQGINGYMELAYAMQLAGFEAVDVHMSDLLSGKTILSNFMGLCCPGGFSYGDVLGAGNGWASTVLFHDQLKESFKKFFARKNTFAIGICNGCQFLTQLKSLIPGCESWPTFETNSSEQFEGRTVMVEVDGKADSVFYQGMQSSRFPIAVAHGEGRAFFETPEQQKQFHSQNLQVLSYVDNYGKITEKYPFNPNGSPDGIAGIKSPDGRVLALMPHPERNIMAYAQSWIPKGGLIHGPWLQMFVNARKFTESTIN